MRLSVDRSDRGYTKAAFYAQPYLNGEPVDGCVTADTDEGYILCHRKNAEGRPFLDENGEVATEERWGTVTIEFLRGDIQ